MSFFRSAWGVFKQSLRTVDAALVECARPFGVNFVNPWTRYSIFVGVYAVVYSIAVLPLPIVSLCALGIGYIGVIAVWRAWDRNENYRARIAKKLDHGEPDKLPDLRGLALLSALQLVPRRGT
jgi:hypothetical protein